MRKRTTKRYYYIFLWITIPLFIYMCYVLIPRNEIGDTNFIELFCIDKVDDRYETMAIYENATGKRNDGLQYTIGSGDSVYSSYVDLCHRNEKNISLDHTSFFLLDEEAAAAGLDKSLDFISREPDIKNNAQIFILKSKQCNSVLKKALEDKFEPVDVLESITNRQEKRLKKPTNTLLYVLNDKEHIYDNLLLPYLVYNEKAMYQEGYATFHNEKMTQLLDYNFSTSIDLFRNNLQSYPLCLATDLYVQLDNIHVTPVIQLRNNVVHVDLKVKTDSTIKENNGAISAFGQEDTAKLNTLEKNALTRELAKILQVTRSEKLDLLNIGSTLEQSIHFEDFNQHWEDYMDNMVVTLSVESSTAKTDAIQPNIDSGMEVRN